MKRLCLTIIIFLQTTLLFAQSQQLTQTVNFIQELGLNVGTGSATPYYQDINFKINLPTKKAGTFSLVGLGGESHINFAAIDEDNLYSTPDGSLRERNFKSLTGFTGLTHSYFFNPTTSGRFILAVSGFGAKYRETFYDVKPDSTAFYKKNTQLKYSVGYTVNKKFNSKNQVTAGVIGDLNDLELVNDYIPDGAPALTKLYDIKEKAALVRGFVQYYYRFNEQLSTNLGLYQQVFTLNNSTGSFSNSYLCRMSNVVMSILYNALGWSVMIQ